MLSERQGAMTGPSEHGKGRPPARGAAHPNSHLVARQDDLSLADLARDYAPLPLSLDGGVS